MKTDQDLVPALQRGDEEALGEIITRYTPYVGAIVWNIVRDSLSLEDAKEIVSDVFCILWQNAAKARADALKGYLGSIARSRALNALRKQGRALKLEDDMLDRPIPGPEDTVSRMELYAALRRAVESLPEPDRSIFLRYYYLGQNSKAISEALSVKQNTVTSKLRRGRERLRTELEKGGYFIDGTDFRTL